jgi:hypothetical protein
MSNGKLTRAKALNMATPEQTIQEFVNAMKTAGAEIVSVNQRPEDKVYITYTIECSPNEFEMELKPLITEMKQWLEK